MTQLHSRFPFQCGHIFTSCQVVTVENTLLLQRVFYWKHRQRGKTLAEKLAKEAQEKEPCVYVCLCVYTVTCM